MAYGLDLGNSYATSFAGTKFVPQSLGDAGLLATDATTALTMIPALNLEAETKLANQALVNDGLMDRQQLISDTYLQLDKLKAEREKKKMIAELLFAGSDDVLSAINPLNRGVQTTIHQGVVNTTGRSPLEDLIEIDKEDITGLKKIIPKARIDVEDFKDLNVTNKDIEEFNNQVLGDQLSK